MALAQGSMLAFTLQRSWSKNSSLGRTHRERRSLQHLLKREKQFSFRIVSLRCTRPTVKFFWPRRLVNTLRSCLEALRFQGEPAPPFLGTPVLWRGPWPYPGSRWQAAGTSACVRGAFPSVGDSLSPCPCGGTTAASVQSRVLCQRRSPGPGARPYAPLPTPGRPQGESHPLLLLRTQILSPLAVLPPDGHPGGAGWGCTLS